MATQGKGKNDWKIKGASIYFIDINARGFPLYYGNIDSDNGDETFLVTAVCQTKGKSKDPVQMTVESKRLQIRNT